MEIRKTKDGKEVVVRMTIGEAIALRDQLARYIKPTSPGVTLKNALETLIPGRFVVIERKD